MWHAGDMPHAQLKYRNSSPLIPTRELGGPRWFGLEVVADQWHLPHAVARQEPYLWLMQRASIWPGGKCFQHRKTGIKIAETN